MSLPLTALLDAARRGDAAAAQAAWPLVYPELKRIARSQGHAPHRH